MPLKKIAIIGAKSLPAHGGAASTIESLISNLDSSFELSVYLMGDVGSAEQIARFKPIHIKVPGIKRINTLTYYLGSMIHALLKGDYDIIHVHHIYAGFIVPFLRLRYKVVTTVHGIIPQDDNKWNKLDKLIFRSIEKISLYFSSAVVSVSKPQIKYLRILQSRKINYIPNGVDQIAAEQYMNTASTQTILTFSAARIIRLKGCDLFLRALKQINYRDKVLIIGDMEQVSAYKNEILSLAQNLEVEFTGLIRSKEQLYHKLAISTIFIFPSTKEGLSNMLLEVASLGIPIVCSDIPENQAVFNSQEVLFFKNRDAADLAEKIDYALHHRDELLQRAILATKKVETYYPWSRIAEEYKQVFLDLLA